MSVLADITENEIVSLDQVDRGILAMLQQDGRASASHIALEIGMSIPAVTDRIKKLQEAGFLHMQTQGCTCLPSGTSLHTDAGAGSFRDSGWRGVGFLKR